MGAALLSEADHSDVTCRGPSSRDELGFPHTARLSTSNVAFKVAFLVLSCKEEHDVMTITLSSYTPYSAPSFSGMPTPCEWSRGFLSCAFIPSPAWGLLSLAFLSISTGQCRTEKNCGSLSSAFFPQQLVAVSFSENCKKITMTRTGRKSVSMLHLAEEMAQKTKWIYAAMGNI